MQIPTIYLPEAHQIAAKKIINASKMKTDISQQMHMANYYALLHSKKNSEHNVQNYAKLLLGK